MTPICSCKNAIVIDNPGGKSCQRCGYWWVPEYGSTEPEPVYTKIQKLKQKEVGFIPTEIELKKRKVRSHLLKRNKLGG